MTDAARLVCLCGFGAPAANAASREELPAPKPAIIPAVRAGYLLQREYVSEHHEIVAGHAVGRDRGVRVHEGIVLHNPECRMVLGFDGVIANGLEKVAGDLKAVVGLRSASCIGPASAAEGGANPVVRVEDIVVRNPDVAEYVSRHEQSAVERSPEVMMHDAPRQVGPDAHGTVPVAPDLARDEARPISRGALAPDVPRHLERVRGFGS